MSTHLTMSSHAIVSTPSTHDGGFGGRSDRPCGFESGFAKGQNAPSPLDPPVMDRPLAMRTANTGKNEVA